MKITAKLSFADHAKAHMWRGWWRPAVIAAIGIAVCLVVVHITTNGAMWDVLYYGIFQGTAPPWVAV